MYAYVDELYPHQTHFSIPFYYSSCVEICVCVCVFAFFEMPLSTYLASEKRFKTKDLVLTRRPSNNLFSSVLFFLK